MRVYREHVTKLVVVLCIFLFIAVMLSYIDTQVGSTWTNMDPDDLEDDRCQWTRIVFDERAERVEIDLEHSTDHEFEVWLVDSEHWNRSHISTGPSEWLGHGIAGRGIIEWSVPRDDLEGELLLVREAKSWGQLGNLPENVTEVRYDWEMTIRSIVNPINSTLTMAMFFFMGLAVVLLALAWFLPREEVPDFKDLYPDFPDSMSTQGEGTGDK